MIPELSLTNEQIEAMHNHCKDAEIEMQLSSEAKIALMTFQRDPKGQRLFAIVSFRPQGNIEISNFTNEAFQAVVESERTKRNTSLLRFNTDGVSVKIIEIVASTLSFLEVKSYFLAVTDVKHNVKNQ